MRTGPTARTVPTAALPTGQTAQPTAMANGANGANGAMPAARLTATNRQRFCSSASTATFATSSERVLSVCRRNILTAGIFSFFVNVLLLAMPIYLFQLSDRVYTSRSTDTLIMLSLVVGGAIVAHVFLDMIRRLHIDARCGRDRGETGSTGSQRGRQGLAERLKPRISDAWRPSAPAPLHHRSRHPVDDGRACRPRLSARRHS